MPSKRDWTEARVKVEEEGRCRNCGTTEGLQAAHIIPRSRVKPGVGEHPLNICVLCGRCHEEQHQLRLELLPLLTREEQAFAVRLVGLEEAHLRLTNRRRAA